MSSSLQRILLISACSAVSLCWAQGASGKSGTAASKAAPAPAETAPENLGTLSLDRTGLTAIPPVVMEKDVLPGFTREMVRVQWRDRDPIYLFVVIPKNVKRPPVVLYLYGYPSDTERFMDSEYCSLLARNGLRRPGSFPP